MSECGGGAEQPGIDHGDGDAGTGTQDHLVQRESEHRGRRTDQRGDALLDDSQRNDGRHLRRLGHEWDEQRIAARERLRVERRIEFDRELYRHADMYGDRQQCDHVGHRHRAAARTRNLIVHR